MNILMVTNTYSPHVGGVARSVSSFTEEYRRQGHRVVVITPEFHGRPKYESDIIRVPAIQKFNGSDFSVRLPIPAAFLSELDDFVVDIVHAHHPFLLGDTALFLSASENVPMVFTHHTMYEQYTHYIPGDSPVMQRFAVELSTGYANLCDLVFAPSGSIAKILRQRGVTTPVEVLPTGIPLDRFVKGNGVEFRKSQNIPQNAFVVGHLGRLAPEKNLEFLSRAVERFMKINETACFVVAGEGPSRKMILEQFTRQGLGSRLRFCGNLDGQQLTDAYHAMNAFAFASKSETQGIVLIEAMAAGVPVVALDAPGIREVVQDGHNGRLLTVEDEDQFASALSWVNSLKKEDLDTVKKNLLSTAEKFSIHQCATQALGWYEHLLSREPGSRNTENSMWSIALRMINIEWEIWANRAHAAGAAFQKLDSSRNSE